MSDTQLQTVRAISGHAQFGSPRGRSRTMGFLLTDCPRSGPTFIADEYPWCIGSKQSGSSGSSRRRWPWHSCGRRTAHAPGNQFRDQLEQYS
eukprot:821803-Pyramimonas_sp.AAC.1